MFDIWFCKAAKIMTLDRRFVSRWRMARLAPPGGSRSAMVRAARTCRARALPPITPRLRVSPTLRSTTCTVRSARKASPGLSGDCAPTRWQSTALHGFAHCHGVGDLGQFAGSHIVDVPVDWNGLGDQRVVADAPDVGDEAGGVVFHGEPIN